MFSIRMEATNREESSFDSLISVVSAAQLRTVTVTEQVRLRGTVGHSLNWRIKRKVKLDCLVGVS